jgi:diacylglycerol kinase (ATP)
MVTRALLVYNPGAGGRELHAEVKQAVSLLSANGWDVEWCETECVDDAAAFAREATALDRRVVLVAGGDGTIGRAVDGLLSTANGGPPPTLGILPCGTGNVLARQLGLPFVSIFRPHAMQEAAQIILEKRARLVDVGRVNGRHFLCWAGVGLDAQITALVESQPEVKRRWGQGAFFLAVVPTLRGPLGTRALVRADGARISRRLVLAVVSNIRLYGGYLYIAPEARMDDGLLDVCCFQGHTVTTVLHLLWQVILGRHTQDRLVTYHKARRIEIRTAHPLPLHADGEPFGTTPATIEVLPRALNLLLPRTLPDSLFNEP